jgi:predicted esterase
VVSRRQSFENARDFVKDIGGRTVILQPEGIEYVDSMECVLVEPMGKILSPNEFVSTGLVVCLEGCSHESNEMDDWGEVLKATKWLDAGLSFALPDVSCLAEASDVEQAVSAVMEKAGFQSCLLVGKGWGGQLASEIAARPRLCERVDGVLLIAPESPPPAECSRIEMPVMLVWAQNDEECPFVEIREWYELLESRRAPTWVSDPASGGHDFAELMKQGETAGQVGNFTVSCLVIGHIVKTLEEVGSNLDSLQLSDALARLCDELPIFLANQLRGDPEQGVAACISGEPSRIKRQMKELCSILKKWIREGMTEMASATE